MNHVLLAIALAVAAMTPSTALHELSALPPELRNEFLADLSPPELAQLERMTEPLGEFIPRVSTKYSNPLHLSPFVEKLEQARDRELRLVVHAPPRHTKTETVLHSFAWLLGQQPWRTNAFATYASDLSYSKSRKARQIARNAGVELDPEAQRVAEWRTTAGGGLLATGVGGPFTGHGVSGLLVVDDPVKNRVEAESETTRETVWDWFNDVAYTRLEPGASVIVVMTRWHPDDLAGKLVREKGWEYLKLPAIDGEGRALWPERFPVSKLDEIRAQINEYSWVSLYQGEPRARGGAVFGDVHTYDAQTMNFNGMRVALGADCAYSAKTHADYSVGLVLGELEGKFYVREVQRHQIKAPIFKTLIDGLKKTHSVRRSRWYTSTTEEGTAELLGVTPQLARGDKFIRAQRTAAAWNAGKILVPTHAPWVDAFVSEMASFTGLPGDVDDQVDALVAAHDELADPAPTYSGLPRIPTSPRRM